MRTARPGVMPSHHFLAFDEARAVHAALAPQGYRLLETCRVRDWRGYITTVLTWYRTCDHTLARLHVRVRTGAAAAL